MDHCEEYIELISAAVDGALSPREREELDLHLAACPACRSLYEELRSLHAALAAMPPVETPPGLSGRVMDAVAAQAGKGEAVPFAPGKAPSVRWRRWLASAAALALVATGAWSWSRREERSASGRLAPSALNEAVASPLLGEAALPAAIPASGADGDALSNGNAGAKSEMAGAKSVPSAAQAFSGPTGEGGALPEDADALTQPVGSRPEAVNVLVNYIYELVGEVEPAADSPGERFSVNSPTGAVGTVICADEDEEVYFLDSQDGLSSELFHYSVSKRTGEVILLG